MVESLREIHELAANNGSLQDIVQRLNEILTANNDDENERFSFEDLAPRNTQGGQHAYDLLDLIKKNLIRRFPKEYAEEFEQSIDRIHERIN